MDAYRSAFFVTAALLAASVGYQWWSRPSPSVTPEPAPSAVDPETPDAARELDAELRATQQQLLEAYLLKSRAQGSRLKARGSGLGARDFGSRLRAWATGVRLWGSGALGIGLHLIQAHLAVGIGVKHAEGTSKVELRARSLPSCQLRARSLVR